jgi:membrane protease YdiL (CAAX protease family)
MLIFSIPTHLTDHILAAALIAVSAHHATANVSARVRESPRAVLYGAGAITGVGMALLFPLVWWLLDRPLPGFGLAGWTSEPPATAFVWGVGWMFALILSSWLVLKGYARDFLTRFYGSYNYLMPRDRQELSQSWLTSAAAGAGEEIAYRGFLIWYLAILINLPAAVLLCSFIFGLAHGYQRRTGMIFATSAGLLLSGAYLVSGSLLLVMWMHASYNMASFTLGLLLLKDRPEAFAANAEGSASS